MRLPYRYGGEHPREGGMDCSGTVQWIFSKLGYTSIPRTADDQYRWLKSQRRVHKARASNPKIWQDLRPGHLLFWKRKSWFSRRINHVMIYAGYDPKSRRHLAFGARGRSKTGINGTGVDFHPLDLEMGGTTKFVGYAALPGFTH
jgi:cell wall-associated NlpC family hydrolase